MPASFLISTNLLIVKFTDNSTAESGITGWAWNFGFSGGSGTSTNQNPTTTFPSPGSYDVTLTITYQDTTTSSITRKIIVDTKPILPLSLADFVAAKLQKPFPINPEVLEAYIKMWQLYMQPVVNYPGVADTDTFIETAYPPIVNALIGNCVAYQMITDFIASNAGLAVAGGIGENEPIVKAIETGPSNAHFQDASAYLKYLSGPNGLLQQVRNEMCTLSARCMISIAYCPPLPTQNIVPVKAGRKEQRHLTFLDIDLWTIYPYIIPIII